MRKTCWILAALLLFGTLSLNAETYKKCKDRCKGEATCTHYCDCRNAKALNACSQAAMAKLTVCQKKAKTDEAKAKCETTFKEKDGPYCRDDKRNFDLSKFKCQKGE